MARELHILGLSPDGRHLLLARDAGAARPGYLLAVDAELERALKGERPQAGPDAAPGLTPRDIQARLRAGQSPAQVAADAGLPLARVERFAGPVLSERARVLDQALRAVVRVARGEPGSVPLGEAVTRQLAVLAHVRPDTVTWTAFRRPDATWGVRLEVVVRGRARLAEWLLDPSARCVEPLDRWAATLGRPPQAARASARPRPTALRVTPARPSAAAARAVPPRAVPARAVPARAVPPRGGPAPSPSPARTTPPVRTVPAGGVLPGRLAAKSPAARRSTSKA